MIRSRSAAALLAFTVVASSLLVACGGDGDKKDSVEEPSQSATPTETATSEPSPTEPTVEVIEPKFGPKAKGAELVGADYTFKIPTAWVDNTNAARELASDIDVSAWESDGTDGFRNNVAVTWVVATGGNLDDLEADVTVQLTELAKQMEALPRIMLDGRPMAHHSGLMSAKPVNYVLDQYTGIDEEGQVTVIAFSYAKNVPAKVRTRTTNSILASWKWSS